MGTGQVSIWVPIAVGVIGLIGVVLGQFINAWREDRRWKREVTHEEQRWRREARQSMARERNRDYWEQQNRNLDRQFEACASMATALHKWHGLLLRLDRAHQTEPVNIDPLLVELTQLEITVDECIGRILLVCDKAVSSAAISAWAEYGKRVDLFTDHKHYASLDDEQIETIWDLLNAENHKFLAAARTNFKPSRRAAGLMGH